MEEKAEVIFKVLILGESTVGKSSLLVRFADDQFIDDLLPTIGVDCRPTYLEVKNRWIKLKIWDTAGQERYRSITKSFYHGAHGAIVVYDVTNVKTYDSVMRWVKEMREVIGNIPMVLVGNKTDVHQNRDLTNSADILANELSCEHFEVSALNGNNVKEAFMALCELMLSSAKHYEMPPAKVLERGEEERSCIC